MTPDTRQASAARTAERPSDVLVPLVDRGEAGHIYGASITWMMLVGALVGLVVVGWLAYGVVAGGLAIAGFGQVASGGTAPMVVVGAGIGVALGGLIGGVIAMLRLPRRHPSHPPEPERDRDR